MNSVWVFQDLMDGTIRVFAHEEDAKKFALAYFEEAIPEPSKEAKEMFMEDWSADEGMIRLDEVEVE